MCSPLRLLAFGLIAAVGILLVASCNPSESSKPSIAEATEKSAEVAASATDSSSQSSTDSEATDSTNSGGAADENDTDSPSASNSNEKDTDKTSVADTAKVECPIEPKKGNVTIRVDSTEKDWTFDRKPDSQLSKEFERRYGKYSKVYDYGHGDLNKDGVMDLVINVGPETPSQHSKFTDIIYIGCGKNRYVKASPELELQEGYSFLESEEKWPDLRTSNGIKYGPHATPSFYGFTRTYRFDESEGRYRLVPGSARYTEKAAKRLGIDPENPPSCPEVGTSPPFLVESDDGKIETGSEVRIKPVSEEAYTVSWKGNLNKDSKSDLILSKKNEGKRITSKMAYAGCSNKFYVEVCDVYVSSLSVGEMWKKSNNGNPWKEILISKKHTATFGRAKYDKCY